VFKTSLLWPSGRKGRSSSARYRADNVEVNSFFLNSPGYCKRLIYVIGRLGGPYSSIVQRLEQAWIGAI